MSADNEIKTRIKSIKDTRKITNAMYLISSTKIKRAKSALEDTRPYFYSLRSEIKRIFRTFKDIESIYFYPKNMNDFVHGDNAILVITGDKGLAGPYNQNVIKKTMEIYDENCSLFVIGEYGRQYFKRHGIPVVDHFNFSSQHATLEEAKLVETILLEDYKAGKYKKIFIVYTDYDGKTQSEAKLTRLLPFHRDYFDDLKKDTEKSVKKEFEFTTDATRILEILTENYIVGFIYGALIDSYCSELEARMNAMKSSNQNADNILEELSLEYNRLRQAAITQEITEVSAGAKFMKLKRKKGKRNG